MNTYSTNNKMLLVSNYENIDIHFAFMFTNTIFY